MADISSIILPDGNNYDIKDNPSRETSLASLLFGRDGIPILGEKTYTNVIATANDNNGAGFFYLKVRPDYFTGNTTTVDSRELWHVKTRVISTVPGQSYYYTDTIFDIWGRESTYCVYSCANQIYSTSYRPIYYNSIFFTNSTGYTNNCGHWIGFNLIYSTNPTSTSYKRTVTVQLLAYDNCEVELQDSLITPTNIPNRAAHTAWYASTDTSYTNFDACTNGLKQSGDANSTSIHALYRANGNYVANSALYRYQLLFQIDENQLTPLNNINNDTGTTKTMLTNVEFDPFGWIYYYATTTNVAAAGGIGAGALYFHYSGVDLRFTFNCGSTLTAHKPFYLVVTPLSNGNCKIASSTPWTQTLPSTNDGKWYILLGRTYSTYQCTLYDHHPIYYYDGTSIKQVLPVSTTNNYTFAEGSTNGAFSVTPSGGTAQSVPIHGLGNLAYKDSLTAVEVGALPNSTTIPDSTSDLVNDSGFIDSSSLPLSIANGGSGATSALGARENYRIFHGSDPAEITNPQEGDVYIKYDNTVANLQNEVSSLASTVSGFHNVYVEGISMGSVTTSSLYKVVTKSVAKTGYTPIGIVGFDVGNSYAFVSKCDIYGSNAELTFRKSTSGEITVTPYVWVLYTKN